MLFTERPWLRNLIGAVEIDEFFLGCARSGKESGSDSTTHTITILYYFQKPGTCSYRFEVMYSKLWSFLDKRSGLIVIIGFNLKLVWWMHGSWWIALARYPHWRCSVKKSCSWKFRKFFSKTPVLGSLFKKVAGLQAWNFI